MTVSVKNEKVLRGESLSKALGATVDGQTHKHQLWHKAVSSQHIIVQIEIVY